MARKAPDKFKISQLYLLLLLNLIKMLHFFRVWIENKRNVTKYFVNVKYYRITFSAAIKTIVHKNANLRRT